MKGPRPCTPFDCSGAVVTCTIILLLEMIRVLIFPSSEFLFMNDFQKYLPNHQRQGGIST
jgi:hypothetical protein